MRDKPQARDAAVTAALEVAALASRPQPRAEGKREVYGDPVDLALLTAAETAGVDRAALAAKRPQEGMVPFSSDRKFMASCHRDGPRLVALVGFAESPADGVRDAIVRLRAAGLRTVMLTGDQRATATAVGRELNLLDEGQSIIDGRELDALSDADLTARLSAIAAFSRITPQHKLRLAQALQARGDIVAMLGDGVNDASALRKADIGVAMGIRGTDVAKEAASIVLQDDRFETVTAAVEEGRIIFDNIRKFVFYLFSCNVAEVLVLLFAALGGLPMPLMPLQILWLNMVTDTFPALALSNPYAIVALVFSIVLQLATVYVTPLADILGLVPPASRDWLIIIAFALGPAVVGQVIKLGRRRR